VAASITTPLCDLLGIDVPILCAGMGWTSGPELAAAVSEAGGLGVLGNGSGPREGVRLQIERTRELTDEPIGLNVIVAIEEPDDLDYLRDQISFAAGLGVDHFVLFWGEADPFVQAARETGPAKVLIQVGSVQEAEAAVAAGVDAVIVQGVEAGGHVRGTSSIWEVLPEAVQAVAPVPVIASGGIGDADGFARALALGAQGVSLGTRFVASDEADAHPDYKRRIVDARATDTVYTEDLYDVGWPNAPHRTLRNTTFAEWEAAGRPPLGKRPREDEPIGHLTRPGDEEREWARYEVGSAIRTFTGDLDSAPLWAGESVDVVNDVRPAGDIVRELAAHAAAIIEA
jgi:NAD(P)H-dependent flavin oxidoreductase YrpB (nitropropane dioxygenase family)